MQPKAASSPALALASMSPNAPPITDQVSARDTLRRSTNRSPSGTTLAPQPHPPHNTQMLASEQAARRRAQGVAPTAGSAAGARNVPGLTPPGPGSTGRTSSRARPPGPAQSIADS